ncbi:UDP-glucuronosyltransferase [Candidatus Woesearchaeota archaeon]|nr:UDP-glucuronosyltransferase [Candidatus Woesearchaeota archaeon]
MVNILYGVSGEGSGHSSRSKEVLSHLAKKHNVHVITYGKAYPYLKQYFPTTEIYGLHLDFKNNKVSYAGTFKKNIQNLITSSQKFKELRTLLERFKPDVIITDFEPTCYYLSKLYHLPLISLDNQHRITNLALDVPKRYRKEYLLCKVVILLFIPKADAYFVTSFFKEKITKKQTFLFPSILRKEVVDLQPTQGSSILVYQTSTSNQRLLTLLQQMPEQFIIYGYDQDKKKGNLTFKKFSTQGFLKDLAACKAVITNGGFTLMTEALHLRKPILSEPIQGQFEQIVNAYYVEKLGYGLHRDVVEKKDVLLFLQHLPIYRNHLRAYKNKDMGVLFKTLDKTIKKLGKKI